MEFITQLSFLFSSCFPQVESNTWNSQSINAHWKDEWMNSLDGWIDYFTQYNSVQFSRSVVSNFLRPCGLQHARLPCPSPTSGAYSNSRPLSQWCHPTISSFVIPFSFCLQSFPASGSFPMSQFFASGGQSMGVSASASVLSMNIQDWSPLGWSGWISL